ncbi:MAG: aspartate--tRNA ligase [Erysipelotrichaceae bacterium]|jgi:aspartyl-tRNA synthetase|nr:aspartate--tRNA ligase [Erysipelotrichaceae bacterium]
MERSHYNSELSLANLNQKVTLLGWVSKRRNLGSLLFIDLRDRSGIVQVVVNDGVEIPDVRNEYVIQVKGVVAARGVANPKLKTGEIEVVAEQIILLNSAKTTPLIIADETDALEETRLKYRYLDLRRPVMQKYFDIRDTIKMTVHSFMHQNHFIEIETPMLCASSPEGAKEYLVPSRVHPGSFYALPQSPQMFKQLLMVAGFERYYQIARCFRDEDLRADRQPDFTQIDIETSFLDQNQFLSLMENLVQQIFKNTINYDVPLPLRQMTYHEAMERFGSDKPDTRFGLELNNLKAVFASSGFAAFAAAEAIRAIVVPGVADITTRKVIDELNLEAKKFGLGGLTVIKKENGVLTGSILKMLSEAEIKGLEDVLTVNNNDIIILAAGADNRVTPLLGAIRIKYGRQLGLVKEGTYDLLWVIDFPMFERDVETGEIHASHHPFTRPRDEDLPYLDTDPTKVLSYAYDIVINGYEAGGGTMRIYNQDVQRKIFEILGLSPEDINKKFGYFVDALQYGTPPHAGMAFGLDRLAMILGGTDNIRDVIAFPKNLAAVDPMTNAPTPVTDKQLEELGIKIVE